AGADHRFIKALDGAPPGFRFEAVGGDRFGFVPGLPERGIVMAQRIDAGGARPDQFDRAPDAAGLGEILQELLLSLQGPSMLLHVCPSVISNFSVSYAAVCRHALAQSGLDCANSSIFYAICQEKSAFIAIIAKTL